MKAVVEKKDTGARWSSDDHKSSVWTKTSLGRDHTHDTLPVGTTVTNFWPLRGWNKARFRLISLHS